MSALIPFLVLDQTSDQVQVWVKQRLAGAGFRVVQTFDLQDARLAHPECPCPHHGTENCTCQMVVLLVYRKQREPATLVIHGQDGKTWISIAGSTGRGATQHTETAIRRALIPRLTNIPAPVETVYDARSTL
ncbi:MAG: hypothetical protein HZC39_13215 [Chloroflexi bacterium]|nr:hypothetical protein [Chloroflexota bacterium]MBI5704486.1 hypothetical protein [Chloroflexota bacterium]GER78842.1 conserved hypothetical protein [Candidatus Denitrolinea symbiosum]